MTLRYFKIIEIIDYSYFALGELYKEISKPVSPLERMVDEATGYGEDQSKKRAEATLYQMNQIVKGKKMLNKWFGQNNDTAPMETSIREIKTRFGF